MKSVWVTDHTQISTPLKNEKIFMKCALNRRCISLVYEQSFCKVLIKMIGNVWATNYTN